MEKKSWKNVARVIRAGFVLGMTARSLCTQGCLNIVHPFLPKRLNARADFCHTYRLECSDCKIFACGKKLAYAKKLVG